MNGAVIVGDAIGTVAGRSVPLADDDVVDVLGFRQSGVDDGQRLWCGAQIPIAVLVAVAALVVERVADADIGVDLLELLRVEFLQPSGDEH